MKRITITFTDENWKKILKVKGELEKKKGDIVSVTDVVNYMLKKI